MIMEAVALRIADEDAKEAAKAKREQWKEDKKDDIRAALGGK